MKIFHQVLDLFLLREGFPIEPWLNVSEAHDAGRGPGPLSAGQGARRHELGQRGQGAGLHRKAEAAHGSAGKVSGPKFC